MRCVRAASLALAFAALAAPGPAAAQTQSITLGSLKPEFFVAGEPVADAGKDTPLLIEVAHVLQRSSEMSLKQGAPWILTRPGWKLDDIAARCAADDQALGGVLLTYYHGFATHFFLLWQSETTTFDITATVVSCNRDAAGKAAPVIVGLIDQLPGSNGTPWVVRRSQISIPLVTVAGYATTIANRKGNNNINSAALIGAFFGGTAQRDIPGYSDPVRLRAASQHIGDDLNTALTALCVTRNDVAHPEPRMALCSSLGYSTPAASP